MIPILVRPITISAVLAGAVSSTLITSVPEKRNHLIARTNLQKSWRIDNYPLQEEPRGFHEGERIAKVSVWTLLALGIVEIAFSAVSGSVALLADGIDSIGDAGVSCFVWTGLRCVRRNPNRQLHCDYYTCQRLTHFVTGLFRLPTPAYIQS